MTESQEFEFVPELSDFFQFRDNLSSVQHNDELIKELVVKILNDKEEQKEEELYNPTPLFIQDKYVSMVTQLPSNAHHPSTTNCQKPGAPEVTQQTDEESTNNDDPEYDPDTDYILQSDALVQANKDALCSSNQDHPNNNNKIAIKKSKLSKDALEFIPGVGQMSAGIHTICNTIMEDTQPMHHTQSTASLSSVVSILSPSSSIQDQTPSTINNNPSYSVNMNTQNVIDPNLATAYLTQNSLLTASRGYVPVTNQQPVSVPTPSPVISVVQPSMNELFSSINTLSPQQIQQQLFWLTTTMPLQPQLIPILIESSVPLTMQSTSTNVNFPPPPSNIPTFQQNLQPNFQHISMPNAIPPSANVPMTPSSGYQQSVCMKSSPSIAQTNPTQNVHPIIHNSPSINTSFLSQCNTVTPQLSPSNLHPVTTQIAESNNNNTHIQPVPQMKQNNDDDHKQRSCQSNKQYIKASMEFVPRQLISAQPLKFKAKFNNHAKGNFFISKEMIKKMAYLTDQEFNTDIQNDEKLAFGYFKESV
eukprot:CAMPEP_0201565464 /NCGR_PEP_ID=MMETSP0190_2-20130828/4577_1 /ASSEMBLY_ACC=CAM_ASM_000263 /TAXON_ID=37353 /ORGANISM="Rosalina sp." /LENGTH=530 /DNA_ID=CAMNT_0047982977 /DNA_START=192 /DNA_END=1781 /DNA_ORIENTATION=+